MEKMCKNCTKRDQCDFKKLVPGFDSCNDFNSEYTNKIQALEKENKTLKEELLKAREYEFMYKELCK